MREIKISVADPAEQYRDFTVHGKVFSKKKSARTVILIPPTGGLTFLDSYLIKTLKNAGFNVVALSGFNGAWERTPDWHVHDRGLKRGSAACRALMAWSRVNLESESFAVIGTSMGALFASMAVTLENDIHRLVLIAGGAPVHDVIADSIHPALITIRAWREKNYEIKDDHDYRKKLQKAIEHDITDVLSSDKRRKDLVIVAKKDLIIPSDYQYQLVQLLRNPEVIEIDGGHIKTVAYAETFLAKKISNFIH